MCNNSSEKSKTPDRIKVINTVAGKETRIIYIEVPRVLKKVESIVPTTQLELDIAEAEESEK